MDPGAEQALAGVDVADAGDPPRVHQEQLDRRAVRARERVQALRMQRARQRLEPEMRKQRMRLRACRGPQHCAEAARIAQPQDTIAEQQVEVIVLAGRRARRQQAQAS